MCFFGGRRTGFHRLSAVAVHAAGGLAVAPKVASAPRGSCAPPPCGQPGSIPAATNPFIASVEK